MWLEVYLSYECQNDCIFCSVSEQIKEFKNYPLSIAEIKKELIIRRNQFDAVTFTGGEPTLHQHFYEIIKLSKMLNYKVMVTTNGILFSDEKFCKKNIPYIDKLQLSIYGHNASLHNFHTRNKDSFNRLKKALDNLNSINNEFNLSANIVVTKFNLYYIFNIIKLLSSYTKMKHILISMLAPEGNALHNFTEISVKATKFVKIIPPIVEYCENKKIILTIFGIPLCILGKYKIYSNDLFWAPRVTIERCKKGDEIGMITRCDYYPTRKRIKPQKCKKCIFNSDKICGGLFDKYFEEYGKSELRNL